jgi:raffinose/stachyose/melibiose transport system permease protein
METNTTRTEEGATGKTRNRFLVFMKKAQVGHKIRSVFSYGIMGLFSLMTVYPLVWLLVNSFKTKTEFMANRVSFPAEPTILNYARAWQLGEMDKLFLNSVFYTVVSTAGVVVLSFMAGFAFAKIRSRATPLLYNIFLIGILLVIQSIMVPLFLLINAIGLYDTHLGVLIPYIGLGLPLGVYLSTEFIKGIPMAIMESARLDGAGFFRIFLTIIMPMSTPVAMTLSIYNITGIWNEFMLINILASRTAIKSLPLGIFRFSGSLASDYGTLFAALVIGMLPMLIFYAAFQKQITKGVTAGAVKE